MTKYPSILLISNYYPVIGGLEKQAQLLAETLVEIGWSIQIVAKNTGNSILHGPYVINKVSIHKLSTNHFEWALLVYLLIHVKRFDIILLNGTIRSDNHKLRITLLLAIITLIKVIFKIPVLMVLGSSPDRFRNSFFKLGVARMLVKQFNAFLPCSSELKNYLIHELNIARAKVFDPPFNFVDTDKFNIVSKLEQQQLRILLGINTTYNVFCYVGRVHKLKGIKELLDALQNADLPIFLLLVLAGEHSQDAYTIQVKNIITSFNSDKIKVFWDDPDASIYMKASDYLIMPSLSEGKGTVQLEAMACGIPCICSQLPVILEDLPEVLKNFTFNPGSNQDIENKIGLALNTPISWEFKKTLREYIIANFSVDIMLEKYTKIFKFFLKS